MNANKLAHENHLNRVTLSVARDPKREEIVVTQKISELGDGGREEISYHFFAECPTSKINDLVLTATERATLRFLGYSEEKIVGGQVEHVVDEPEVAVEKPGGGASATKKATKKAKKKATAKAKAKPKPKLEVVEDSEGEDEDEDALFAEDTVETGEVFNKDNKEHAKCLKGVIIKKLGTDWKENDGRKIVSRLVKTLQAKEVPVLCDGAVLGSFHEFCEDFIDDQLKRA